VVCGVLIGRAGESTIMRIMGRTCGDLSPAGLGPRAGFTLIELLVVIAVIALLIGILLPSLGGARAEGRAIKCAAGVRSVAQAVIAYTSDSKSFFPPAYVYGATPEGMEWKPEQQTASDETGNGYVHWSWALFSGGFTSDSSFRCPTVYNGGAPATNAGGDLNDWESEWQVSDSGGAPGQKNPVDRQVKRLAYTGNAAIFPRNKFVKNGNDRTNRLVNTSAVDGSTKGGTGTILVTEFLDKDRWKSIANVDDKSKSHRPVTPFVGGSSGADVYKEPEFGGGQARFFYPKVDLLKPKNQVGAYAIEDVDTTLNAVGRHHPGGDDLGGSANFAFVDGHVERSTIKKTVEERKWGDGFFSLSGGNIKVDIRPEPK